MTSVCLNRDIVHAVNVLNQGGVIAFPTETYYGLGVDPFNINALERLFTIKQRSTEKAILLLIEDKSQIKSFAKQIPEDLSVLEKAFWPGPLTLVFPAHFHLSSLITGGTKTVAIRQSPHPCVKKLLNIHGSPVTGTSANISGQSPATTAQQVADIFGSDIDFILDGGATLGGQGSTLVGYDKKICCIREGKIPFSMVLSRLKELKQN